MKNLVLITALLLIGFKSMGQEGKVQEEKRMEASVAQGSLNTESPIPFKLFQNSPNPVKSMTYINFQLNSPGFVSLELFDMLGNPVATLMEEDIRAGHYSVPVSVDELPEGIYFYVLKRGSEVRSMKMIVSK